MVGTSYCKCCERERTVDNFYWNPSTCNFLNQCKDCKSAKNSLYQRSYKQSENGVARTREAGWKFRGINFKYSEYLKLHKLQESKCAICKRDLIIRGKTSEKGTIAHVDHDKIT